MADEYRIDAPDVASAFEKASKGEQKDVERPKPALEYRPPSPAPSLDGAPQHQSARPQQVSPELRGPKDADRESKIRSTLASMLAKREFNRAAKRGYDR